LIAVGHTDSAGPDACNQRLSVRRADANRIRTEARGKSQPVADNATAEGQAKNRRVDIEVVEAKAK